MFFNFKNKNMLIILLLLVVLASIFCYSFMMKSVEGNTNLGTTVFSDNFKIVKKDHVTNTEYYTIDPNTTTNEISFVSDTPITALTPVIVPVTQVTGNINEYMYANSYDMYRKVSKTETPPATEANPTPVAVVKEEYEFYKISVPYSLSVVSSTTTPVVDTTTPVVDSTVATDPVAQSDETQAAALLQQAATTPETASPMSTLTTTFSMQGSGLSAATITSLQMIISQQASIVDPNGTNSVPIAPSQVTITEVSQGEAANSLLKIDISVPSANKDTIIAQLTIFSSVQSFNTALTTGGIVAEDLTIVNKMVDLAVQESFMNLEGFGNMGNFFSKLFGKKVKEGNTNLGTTTNNLGNVLIGIRNNDYTKVYSKSGNILNITINTTDSTGQKTVLIQDGTLKVQPQSQVSTPPTTTTADPNLNLTAASAISGGGSVNIGDINVPGGVPGGYYPQYPSYVKDACGNYVPSYNQQMNPYMLPGSDPILMNQYNTPFYGQYSSFESAMNNPSNPLVNPVNSMNPVEYSQTLFGPWTTPMMSKTACLNCDETKEKVNGKNGSKGTNGSNGSDGSNGSNNVFNNLNSQANTMMAQNGEVDENEGSNVRMNKKSGNSNNNFSEYGSNSNNSGGVNNNNQAPCPPCGRCPDASNFECKKVPNYEMGLDNTALPRPILSDFSTFGT